jgi:hypothetical protein
MLPRAPTSAASLVDRAGAEQLRLLEPHVLGMRVT